MYIKLLCCAVYLKVVQCYMSIVSQKKKTNPERKDGPNKSFSLKIINKNKSKTHPI